MTDKPEINPGQEEAEAIDRIARTHDGRLLHRHLRRILETCVDFQEAGALQAHNGRRTLARDLMGLMAQGIEGTRGGRDEQRGDEPILNRQHRPAGGDRRFRGANRRVGPDEHVDKFLAEHGGPDAA